MAGSDAFRAGPFNEAPIHESGKWGAIRRPTSNGMRPSMRPRFMNRGSIRERPEGGMCLILLQ